MSTPANLTVAYLRFYAERHREERLSLAVTGLAQQLGARRVALLDDRGEPLHGRFLLGNALREAARFAIEFELNPEDADRSSDEDAAPPVSRPANGPPGRSEPPGATPAIGDLRESFIREFDRLERYNDFMWIGFVLKTLLPQIGLSELEARDFFRQLESDGIVVTSKEPNPRRPEFPTTRVRLNREHPAVRQALASGAPPQRRFPLGRVTGELLSETIIRERR
jgi:hypothetical protein